MPRGQFSERGNTHSCNSLAQNNLQIFHQLKFESKVVICEPKSLKQKNHEGKEELVNGYNVVLQDTILFPEGGGQVSLIFAIKFVIL